MRTQSGMNWSINSVHIQPSVSSVSASLHIMPVCYITSRRLNCRGLFYRIGTLAAIIKDPPNHTAYTPRPRLEEEGRKRKETKPNFTRSWKKTFFILWQRRKKQNKTHCSSKGRRSSVTDNWLFVIFLKSKVFSDANWFFFPHWRRSYTRTLKLTCTLRASVLLSDTWRLPSRRLRTRLSKGALLSCSSWIQSNTSPPKFKCSGLINCWSWWKWMWHTSLSVEL